ncbi:MAG: hypothetical protein K2X41_11835 [Hyphomicrobium sp.]|nr:hypothetical protein [Hyphomicrobium sp.]
MRPLTSAVSALILAVGLAGCEAASNALGNGGTAPQASITTLSAGQPGSTQLAKVQIAPIIGSPENVARDLQTQLTASLERGRISVASAPNASSEYTLRGYIVAAREKSGSKISYIWDVTDQGGKRVNRITGEEIATGAAKDPWSAVTPQMVQSIADKTATQIASWLPGSSAIPVASAAPLTPTPVAAASPQSIAAVPAASPIASPITTAAVAPPSALAAPAAAQTTGSIEPSGPVTTMVPTVVGAPGDGGTTLTSAIQRELTKNGVTLTNAASPKTYKVEGKVAMGQTKDGKQPIRIDWNVVDPAGKKLGTVSQNNEVPQGSLDGSWGKTADAAAAAAAQGILKLLPQNKAVN